MERFDLYDGESFQLGKTRELIMHAIVRLGAVALPLFCLGGEAWAYSFGAFGGRQGRPGVTDELYTWNLGASGGSLSWFLNRDQLTLADSSAAQFTQLQARIQPELNKWSSYLDLNFVQAPNAAAANILFEFRTTFQGTGQAVPNAGGKGAAAQYNSVARNTLNSAEVAFWPSNNWATDMNDFSYVALHETGHTLGLGDLYLAPHGDGSFEGEDFIDHGLPSGAALPNPNGKRDNVMQTRGVMTLDNDDIAGAQWSMGGLGVDSIVTGQLAALAAGSNATRVAAHHGPNKWIYRGTSSVAGGLGNNTVVEIDAFGATAATSLLGNVAWNINIQPDKVIFTGPAAYAGNFIFDITSPNPEGYINAFITDNTPTAFTATPSDAGVQLFPSPQIFGPIPEPSSAACFAMMAGLGLLFRRKARGPV